MNVDQAGSNDLSFVQVTAKLIHDFVDSVYDGLALQGSKLVMEQGKVFVAGADDHALQVSLEGSAYGRC